MLLSCVEKAPGGGKGFVRSLPESEGVLTEGILRFLEDVQANGIDMHSLMILRNGKVITEGWWYPYRPEHRHIMHSVSKTFTATAIGFAVQEQLLSVEDAVISFFPDDLPKELSPYLEALTVKHLLTMSVGQEPAPSLNMDEPNWVKAFLATPLVHAPGSTFLYSSYATYMLSAILEKVSGETTYDYLGSRLFEPLGIRDIVWEKGAAGISAGGWGMRIKTEDMARLGQFYLQQGRWNGRQLLSKDWIQAASSVQIYQRDSLSLDEELNDEWAQGYGYQIWRSTHNAYRADGADGQFIIVMPEQNAVVAITENTGKTQLLLQLVFKHLQPVMIDKIYTRKEDDKEQWSARLSALAIPDPFRTNEETTPPHDLTLAYTMEPNEQDIRSLSFTFDRAGGCRLSLNTDEKAYVLDFGLDTWRYGQTERTSPYFRSPRRNPEGLSPFTVAGYGSRTEENVLWLRLLYVEDYQEETFVCRFADDSVDITLSDSFAPAAPPVTLHGSLRDPAL